jgi:hypothetical protein
MRVTVLPPWPNTIIALTGDGCSMSSGFASTASNQRVVGIPFASMNFWETKRPFIHS